MEADERQIFDGCLQELKTQLIGLFAVRRNLGQFMDDLGSLRIVPAGTLSGTKLANRNDQVSIPAVNLRIDILGNEACRPDTADLEFTGSVLGIPCSRRLGGNRAVQTELGQLVISCLHAAACLCFCISKIGKLNRKRLAVEVPAVILLLKAGLDEKLLLRSDGTSVYMTQDIGTATLRFSDYNIDKMIYVVGNEQNYHFQVLSLLLDKLGFSFGKDLVHFSYGMVELPEGKMKSREGTVVDSDDLMDEMVTTATQISKELGKLDGLTEKEIADTCEIIGMGALKYFLLKVDPRKNMVFNPKESIDFNGNTGPFIQYTYARIKSVLRKAEESGVVISDLQADLQLSDKEAGLVQTLAAFPAVVAQAGVEYSPSQIANYIYDLVKQYNQFYHDFQILKEENEALRSFRLVLSRNVAKVISRGMSLLGIQVPEKM